MMYHGPGWCASGDTYMFDVHSFLFLQVRHRLPHCLTLFCRVLSRAQPAARIKLQVCSSRKSRYIFDELQARTVLLRYLVIAS
jgi:hypothetical protein